MQHPIGTHFIVDMWGARYTTDADRVLDILNSLAVFVNATVINSKVHTFDENGGLTAILHLAESHITIHTWPEHKLSALDIFMCGEINTCELLKIIQNQFQPKRMDSTTIIRGKISSNATKR